MLRLNAVAMTSFISELQKLATTGAQYLDLANKAASAGRKTISLKVINRARKETFRKWLPMYLALQKESRALNKVIRR